MERAEGGKGGKGRESIGREMWRKEEKMEIEVKWRSQDLRGRRDKEVE